MNKFCSSVLKAIYESKFLNQRELAKRTSLSLGTVNKAFQDLVGSGYLDSKGTITAKGHDFIQQAKPSRAIILAAEPNIITNPINPSTPNALLKVNGQTLIERILLQLQEVDVNEIYIVVGFLKEQFEFLIDQYNVKLLVNPDYAAESTLFSLSKAIKYIEDAYIISPNVRCENNPFHVFEPYSWCLLSDAQTDKNGIIVTRKGESVFCNDGSLGNTMVGISYISKADSAMVQARIREMCADQTHSHIFWEAAITDCKKLLIASRIAKESSVAKIDTFEQLLSICNADQSDYPAIKTILDTFHCDVTEIKNIALQKKGMTNRSFTFSVHDKRYIMRLPGEGTDQMINRFEEAAVYNKIASRNICDDICCFNAEDGYKITVFYENSRCCDPYNKEDVTRCMKKLREFHSMNLQVKHEFAVFRQLQFYEDLWNGKASVFPDYARTKANVLSLKDFVLRNATSKCLSHIDSVPDNFLFIKNADGEEEIRLIDWEYAGMQDPHIDIAMFAIYSLYEKEWIDSLINSYFPEGCSPVTRLKIYCYIAICGLLWSNWCEYKSHLGIEFGEYSLRQYRYAKDYYKIALAYANEIGEVL